VLASPVRRHCRAVVCRPARGPNVIDAAPMGQSEGTPVLATSRSMADCLDRFHRVLVLDPIAAPIVQRIFDMYVRPGLGHQDHCSTPDRRRHSVPVRS